MVSDCARWMLLTFLMVSTLVAERQGGLVGMCMCITVDVYWVVVPWCYAGVGVASRDSG